MDDIVFEKYKEFLSYFKLLPPKTTVARTSKDEIQVDDETVSSKTKMKNESEDKKLEKKRKYKKTKRKMKMTPVCMLNNIIF
jgi:hypothetical protein